MQEVLKEGTTNYVRELEIALARARDYGETQRKLNVALEERVDLKERKIAHLEDDLAQTNKSLATCRELLNAKRDTISSLNRQLAVARGELEQAKNIIAYRPANGAHVDSDETLHWIQNGEA